MYDVYVATAEVVNEYTAPLRKDNMCWMDSSIEHWPWNLQHLTCKAQKVQHLGTLLHTLSKCSLYPASVSQNSAQPAVTSILEIFCHLVDSVVTASMYYIDRHSAKCQYTQNKNEALKKNIMLLRNSGAIHLIKLSSTVFIFFFSKVDFGSWKLEASCALEGR